MYDDPRPVARRYEHPFGLSCAEVDDRIRDVELMLADRDRTIARLREALETMEERAEAAERRVAALTEALKEIAFGFDGDEFEDTADGFDRQRDIARSALAEQPADTTEQT